MWPRLDSGQLAAMGGRKLGGFVAFLRRPDAERAAKEMDGAEWGGNTLKIGWGKAVPIPATAIYGASRSPRPRESAFASSNGADLLRLDNPRTQSPTTTPARLTAPARAPSAPTSTRTSSCAPKPPRARRRRRPRSVRARARARRSARAHGPSSGTASTSRSSSPLPSGCATTGGSSRRCSRTRRGTMRGSPS